MLPAETREPRRARTERVNYADTLSGAREKVTDLVLATIDEHSGCVPWKPCRAGGSLSLAVAQHAHASMPPWLRRRLARPPRLRRKLASALGDAGWFAGLDYLTIAVGVHERQNRLGRVVEHVPVGGVRHALGILLRSGKARRRLASSAHISGGSATADVLKKLVLNTLQASAHAPTATTNAAPGRRACDPHREHAPSRACSWTRAVAAHEHEPPLQTWHTEPS